MKCLTESMAVKAVKDIFDDVEYRYCAIPSRNYKKHNRGPKSPTSSDKKHAPLEEKEALWLYEMIYLQSHS